MTLSVLQLTGLIALLEAAKRASTGPGQGKYCTSPRVGEDGKTDHFVPKPKTNRLPGFIYPNGDKLVIEDGIKGIRISNGVHGRAFLCIDPRTKKISCFACSEGVK